MILLTLDQLQVLATLERTGSVSAAARELHRAQSAVSYALRTLERALELELVDHGAYRATLTAAGRAILARAQDVLAGAEAVEHLAAELRGGTEPVLNVLLDALLPAERVMGVLGRVSAGQDATRIDLRVELLGGMVEALERDRPDLVLAALGLYNLPARYACETVGRLAMLPVMAPAHALARCPPPVPLETVRRHVHLVVTSPPGLQTPVDAGLIGAPRRWNFPDFASRLGGLRAGLGFSWMPAPMVEADLRAGTLVPLVLERNAVHVGDVGLIFRSTPPLGPTGRHLLHALRSEPHLLPPLPADLLNLYEIP